MKHLFKISATLLLATTLTGCAVATAGIKKGDERSLAGSLRDVNAGRVIEARMSRAHDFELGGIDVEVAESVAVLSGNVPSQKDKIEAARIAWSAPGIEQVGNELLIKGKQSLLRNTKDGILEKSVRARLLADKKVKARNFNIETHDGIVYVLGVARTQAELKRAAEIAATTRGTRQVISYARISDVPLKSDRSANNTQRQLPGFLTTTPQVDQQAAAPVTNVPLSQPIPFELPSEIVTAPTAPSQLDMGDRLGKEFPSDEELGAYRTGQAGEAVSIIESAPYYVHPDTGEEIPIRFDANGNLIPRVTK